MDSASDNTVVLLLQLDGGILALRGLAGRLPNKSQSRDIKERLNSLAAYVRALPRDGK